MNCIKHSLRTFIILSLAAIFSGCGLFDKREKLYVYNWAEYVSEEVISAFEATYNCRVIIDTFDSNETMYARLRAGASGYDLIFPTSYMAETLWREGMLQAIQHDLIPNIDQIDPTFQAEQSIDSGMVYSVPYMLGTTGIGYRSDRVEITDYSWSVFDRSDLAGRMMMLDDMRETIGAGLKYLGFSVNTTDAGEIHAAADVVIRWKRNLAQFDSEAYKTGLASGSFFVAQGYSGDVRMVIDDEPRVAFFLPKEGFAYAVDDMVIPTSARNVELAHAFINFLCEPENAAANMEWAYFFSPITAAHELLDEDMLNDPSVFVPRTQFANAENIRDVGDALAIYSAAWDRIKAAR
jgi:spermidine/putrescine transport system substrate-binding protein